MLGALLHWRPRSLLDSFSRAMPGVLLQFPFYGSVATSWRRRCRT